MKLHKCGMMERGIHIANGTIGPCSMLPTMGNFTTPDEYWESDEHRKFKENFYSGNHHPTCLSCLESPRFNLSSALPDWGLQVTYGESSVCSFGCRSCRHSNKTERWLEDNHPELHSIHQFETGKSTDAQLQWVLDNLGRTSRLDFFGGDPVLHESTELLLKKVLDYPDCLVYFNYNGAKTKLPSGKPLYDALSPIKNLEFSCSIDATSEEFERLRPGPSFNRVKSNIFLMKEHLPDKKFSLGMTITNRNIVNFKDIADKIVVEFPVDMFDYYLIVGYTPEYLAPWELPFSTKRELLRVFSENLDDPHWGEYYRYFTKLLVRPRLYKGDIIAEFKL